MRACMHVYVSVVVRACENERKSETKNIKPYEYKHYFKVRGVKIYKSYVNPKSN